MTTLTWQDVIGKEKQQAYLQQTLEFVEQQREAGKIIYLQRVMCLMHFNIPNLPM